MKIKITMVDQSGPEECLAEWQRYLKERGLVGHAVDTQLRECLSSETAVSLCNLGIWEEMNITVRI